VYQGLALPSGYKCGSSYTCEQSGASAVVIGAIVGSIGGAILIAVIAFLIYRSRQQISPATMGYQPVFDGYQPGPDVSLQFKQNY